MSFDFIARKNAGSGGLGSSGFSGFSGPQGPPGDGGVGPPGTSGFSGYSGRSGFSGYSGIGLSGFSGYSGSQGMGGPAGQNGASGFSGYSGPTGTSGFSGYSGISGFSGYSGLSGYSGVNGNNGVGVSGFSGYSGRSGFSGYSGSPGGSNTQVQFNNSSAFGGDADLTWDSSNNILNLAQVSASTKGTLSIQQPSSRPAILLTGTGTGAGSPTDAAAGVAMWMTWNNSGNRQFVIGNSDNFGNASTGVFRYLTGTSMPNIDGITGDGNTRLHLNLGTSTSGVAVGSEGLAYNATLPAKLAVYQQSGIPAIWAQNASGATDPVVSLDASVGTNSATPFITFTGDATSGTSQNVNTNAGSLTLQGYVRIIVNGTTRWMPYYS